MMRWMQRVTGCLAAFTLALQVVAQDNTAPTAPFVWPNPSFVWDPVHGTCNNIGSVLGLGTDDEAQNVLLNEVIELAQNARTRMQAYENSAENSFSRAQTRAAFNLFFDVQREDANTRWNEVKAALDLMITIPEQEYLYIMCDDAAMTRRRFDGVLERVYPHDPSKVDILNAANPAACAAQPGMYGYRVEWPRSPLSAEFPIYVILCSANTPRQPTVRQVFSEVTRNSNLGDFTTWTTRMFHEFLHVRVPGMRQDGAGVPAGGLGTGPDSERYGMEGAREVRATYATQNPDSITLFALALALDSWIWVEGSAWERDEYMSWHRSLTQG